MELADQIKESEHVLAASPLSEKLDCARKLKRMRHGLKRIMKCSRIYTSEAINQYVSKLITKSI